MAVIKYENLSEVGFGMPEMQFVVEAHLHGMINIYRLQNDGGWRKVHGINEELNTVLELAEQRGITDPDSPEGKGLNDEVFSRAVLAIHPNDLVFDQLIDTRKFLKPGTEVVVDGNRYRATIYYNLTGIIYDGKRYFKKYDRLSHAVVSPRVISRKVQPKQFSLDDVVKTIRAGDPDPDKKNNLIVDLLGEVSLMEYESDVDYPLAQTTPVAVEVDLHEVSNENDAGGDEDTDVVGERAIENRENVAEAYLSLLAGWQEHLRTGKLHIDGFRKRLSVINEGKLKKIADPFIDEFLERSKYRHN